MPSFVLRCRVENAPYEEVRDPDAGALNAAIRRLDGHRYSDLSFSLIDRSPDEAMDPADRYNALHGLIVAGGPDRVILTFIPDSGVTQQWWFLADPAPGDASEERVVGGQRTPLPARWWVTYAQALQAAHYFFEHLERDPDLTCELDPGSMVAG
jgi:hypothetical protein